jgi:hypothetical protein
MSRTLAIPITFPHDGRTIVAGRHPVASRRLSEGPLRIAPQLADRPFRETPSWMHCVPIGALVPGGPRTTWPWPGSALQVLANNRAGARIRSPASSEEGRTIGRHAHPRRQACRTATALGGCGRSKGSSEPLTNERWEVLSNTGFSNAAVRSYANDKQAGMDPTTIYVAHEGDLLVYWFKRNLTSAYVGGKKQEFMSAVPAIT